MRLVPAEAFSVEELAALFTRGYEGYFVPIQVDAATMSAYIESWDIDLERSRIALVDDAPAGIANLAVRGERGWIAGIGVVPEARRRGIGRALMKAILAQSPPIVSLEVIDKNASAIALYQQLGFQVRRTLEVWTLYAEFESIATQEVAVAPLSQSDLPWQRADESLPPEAIRLDLADGAVIFRVSGTTVSVLQLRASSVETAATLLKAARGGGEIMRFVNVPAGDVASEALAKLGATLELCQLEMLLRR